MRTLTNDMWGILLVIGMSAAVLFGLRVGLELGWKDCREGAVRGASK